MNDRFITSMKSVILLVAVPRWGIQGSNSVLLLENSKITDYYYYFLVTPCSLWDLSSLPKIERRPLAVKV